MIKAIITIPIFMLSFTSCITYKSSFTGSATTIAPNISELGMNRSKLDAFSKYLKDSSETTGMLVLVDGQVVYEYGNVSEISYIASCRKSVLSILFGRYIQDGSMDLNLTIGSLGIDEKDGLLISEKEATINDIITARSGVFHLPANGGYDERNVKERGSVKHGEYFLYNNWDFNVAGHILEQHTGRSIYEEIELQLAIPLGFQDWNIKNQKKYHKKKKSQYPAYHIYISTRDMAKIGQLMLDGGQWNGKQLVSSEWIKKSTSIVTPIETMDARYPGFEQMGIDMAYGYMWWLIQSYKDESEIYKGAFTASGFGGQYITVIPEANMVIAHKTKLKTLVQWGFRPGGVPEWQYWEILERVINARK